MVVKAQKSSLFRYFHTGEGFFFCIKDKVLIDPAVKSGRFLAEIYKRLMDSDAMKQAFPDKRDRQRYILDNQLYGFATSAIAATVTRKALYDDPTIAGNIVYVDRYLVKMADKTTDFKKLVQGEFGENMKFDVVIGNPPYQEDTGGGTIISSAKNIYGSFVSKACGMGAKYVTMIIPTRWYLADKGADKELKNTLIGHQQLRELHDFIKSRQVFSSVDIGGGICYFLWDRDYRGNTNITSHYNLNTDTFSFDATEYDCIIRHKPILSIIRKIKEKDNHAPTFADISNCVISFGLPTNIQGSWIETGEYTIPCKTSQGEIYLYNKQVINSIHFIDKYKLITGYKAPDRGGCNNSDSWLVINNPQILPPGTVHTGTYTTVFAGNEVETINASTYIKTKFARALLLAMLSSTTVSNRTFSLLPVQDFSKPWTDQMLYDKYGLSPEEIKYIEDTIKPME